MILERLQHKVKENENIAKSTHLEMERKDNQFLLKMNNQIKMFLLKVYFTIQNYEEKMNKIENQYIVIFL